MSKNKVRREIFGRLKGEGRHPGCCITRDLVVYITGHLSILIKVVKSRSSSWAVTGHTRNAYRILVAKRLE